MRELASEGEAEKFSEAERDDILRQTMTVLDDARFAGLFAPGSCAEIPIVGHSGDRMVAGQVDRLVVTSDSVFIADYKTNRPAPQTLDEVPPGYVTQLALYRVVLMRLYPGKRVGAALVWTEVPHLMEIPADALDAVLTQLTLS